MKNRAIAELPQDCPDGDELVAFVGGTLAESMDQRIQQHLKDCAECVARVADPAAVASVPRSARRPKKQTELDPEKATRWAMLFEPGELVANRYVIRCFVARGGMGEVYEAFDVELSERVAIKTLRRELLTDGDAVARLKREVSVMRKVAHPSVCRIAELGEHVAQDGRVPFFTMEFIEGETLGDRLLHAGPFAADEALRIASQIAEAIDAVHEAGIIHRDLKSSNVILAEEGRVVVTDFGLAKYAVSDATLTQGNLVGSPPYIAPELIEGKEANTASDIYSFGVVLYEMITGAWPFEGDTPLLTIMKRLSHPPVPMETRRPDVTKAWNHVVMRCLERAPEARYARAMDAVDELRGVAVAQTARASRRRRLPKWTVFAMLAAFVGCASVPLGLAARRSSNPVHQGSTGRTSLAIVEIRNLTQREDVAWLSTALSEMLSSELGSNDVRVSMGEAVARAQRDLALVDRELDSEATKKLRENLGADWIVTGSFTAVGDERAGRVRVDLRVYDARKGVLAQRLNDEGPQLAVLELVRRLGSSLRASIGVLQSSSSLAKNTPPRTPEGLRLYAEGIQLARRFDYALARERFAKLTSLEPSYAPGHAELASVWSKLGEQRLAESEAVVASELSQHLAGDEKLRIDALTREIAHDYEHAVEAYRKLWEAHRDDFDDGAALARVQLQAGHPHDAEGTVSELRLAGGESATLVADELDSRIARALHVTERTLVAARRMRTDAVSRGARRLVAWADRLEGIATHEDKRPDEALEFFNRARREYLDVGDVPNVANVVDDMANVRRDQGHLEEALALFQDVAKAKRERGEEHGVGVELNNIGASQALLGRNDDAIQSYKEASASAERTNDLRGQLIALLNLGEIYLLREELDKAQDGYEKVVDKSTITDDRQLEVLGLLGLSVVSSRRGDLANAVKLSERAQRTVETFGVGAYRLTLTVYRADLAFQQGDVDGARDRLDSVKERLRTSGDQELSLLAFTRLASLHLAKGDVAGARRVIDEAHQATSTLDSANPRLAQLTRYEAELAMTDGRLEQARDLALRATESVDKERLPGEMANCHALLARVYSARGDVAGARSELALAELAAAKSVDPRVALSVAVARSLTASDRAGVELVRRKASSVGLMSVVLEAGWQLRGSAKTNARLR